MENYLAMLHFACAWITFRAAGVSAERGVWSTTNDKTQV